MTRHRLGLVLLLGVTAPASLYGQEKPALDVHGDPLPPFARARLGTARFRNGAPLVSLTFAPDGLTLLTVDDGLIARLWETATGKERHHFRLPEAVVEWALAADHRLLATWADGPEVRLWDAPTGKLLRTLTLEDHTLGSRCLTPDGKLLVAVARHVKTERHTVRGWELPGGKALRDIAPAPAADNKEFQAQRLVVVDGGKALGVHGTFDDKPEFRLWSLPGGAELGKVTTAVEEWKQWHEAAVLSPDGRLLVLPVWVSGRGTTFVLVETATGKKLRELGPPIERCTNILFSPDGRTLLAVDERNPPCLWDTASGRPLAGPVLAGNERVIDAAFAPDGRTLAVGTDEGTIHLWDVAGRPLHVFKGYRPGEGFQIRHFQEFRNPRVRIHFSGVRARPSSSTLTFAPNGKRLAAAGEGGIVRLWTTEDGKPVQPVTAGHEGMVWSLDVALGGRLLASAGEDGTLRLWEPAAGRETQVLTMPPPPPGERRALPRCVALSPNGKFVAAGTDREFLQLYETATGKPVHQVRTEGEVLSLVFTQDSRRLLAGADGVVGWFDAATGRRLHRFSERDQPLADDRSPDPEFSHVGVLSPDGRLLAACGRDGHVRLWELSTGRLRQRLSMRGVSEPVFEHPSERGNRYHVHTHVRSQMLAFAPDGRTLAWLQSEAIVLYDLTTGRELRQLGGQSGRISVAFAPTGVLAAASTDGTVRFWDPATGTLRAEVRALRGGFHSLAFSADGKTLFTGGSDTTILLWDVERILANGKPRPPAAARQELDALWDRLSSATGVEAEDAITRLQAAPAPAVALLRDRLRPVPPVDGGRIARLLDDLGSDRFEVRRRAAEELEKLAELAEPSLRRRLAEKPPPEVSQRVELLLEKLPAFVTAPEKVRQLRAVEVLERIGTPEARAVLEKVAEGASEARLTQEAKAALQRTNSAPKGRP